MLKGQPQAEETKALLRAARLNQVHPSLAARGITIEQVRQAEANGLKWCSGECKAFVPAPSFSNGARKCRPCTAKSVARNRGRKTPEQREGMNNQVRRWRTDRSGYVRNKELLKKYGVGHDWYETQFQKQNGKCAICDGTDFGAGRNFFCVDHDHDTGAVRELLCCSCNYFLGFVEGQYKMADKDWLMRAMDYLQKHKVKA